MIKEENLELIDRASFMTHLFNDIRAEKNTDDVNFGTTITLYDLIRRLCSFPTVNGQEAEWIPDDTSWRCSWCTSKCFYDASGAKVRTRYCPCCGRRMRR